MKNSEYIMLIQKIGAGIHIGLSLIFFRLHFTSATKHKKVEIDKSKAYLHGIGMSLLNTFAIPFYFTSIAFLMGLGYFDYTLQNSFYFSIGSTAGSFTLYTTYASIANKIEHKLITVATKMDFILGCLTGLVGIGNWESYLFALIGTAKGYNSAMLASKLKIYFLRMPRGLAPRIFTYNEAK